MLRRALSALWRFCPIQELASLLRSLCVLLWAVRCVAHFGIPGLAP